MMRPEEGLRAAIERAGLTPPPDIIGDGKLHRFPSNGKKGDDAGWYVLHAQEGSPAGAFGCWRSGIDELWRADAGRDLTPAEEEAHRARMATLRAERDAEAAVRREEARARAGAIWNASKPASLIHPYLRLKKIKPHIARNFKGDLVLPVMVDGAITSLQTITAEGEKRFLPGGRVAGGYCLLGLPAPNGELVLCEGFATGASIREATDLAVAVGFNANNLVAAAKALRARFPMVKLIVAADDDALTPGNPGLTKAKEAAQAVGGLLAVPVFGDDRPEGASDFNDLARARGPEAVRACIDGAARV
jgi:putative DNA primase/helicase